MMIYDSDNDDSDDDDDIETSSILAFIYRMHNIRIWIDIYNCV